MMFDTPENRRNFDVIVVGGGINGAAIARDASLRGLTALLLEAKDFASGASGHNGRMIHGGLRYLAAGDLGLVIEALRERRTLRKIAPHLVKEQALVIPILKSGPRPVWLVGLGLVALNLLDLGRHPRCRWHSRSRVLGRIPGLRPDRLKGAFEMYDAYAENAERLTVENVLAARGAGAEVRNHARVTKISPTEDGKLCVSWQEDGASQKACASSVVNATGAWTDDFLSETVGENSGLVTKAAGSFLVVRATSNAPQHALFVHSRIDGRPVLVTPWLGHLLIGTTDRVVSGPVSEVNTTREEIDYLFDAVDQVFAPGTIRREDVMFTYCGVRPLPFSKGASRETTRKHVIHRHSGALKGMISVFGGKLSTFRSLAEDVTDVVEHSIGRSRSACRTASLPLPGAEDGAVAGDPDQKLGTHTLQRLQRLYGTRSHCILDIVAAAPELAEVLDAETGAIAAEIVYAVRSEFAQTMADVLLRRTLLGYRADRGRSLLAAFGTIAKRHLGWTDNKIKADRDAYLRHIDAQEMAGSCGISSNIALEVS